MVLFQSFFAWLFADFLSGLYHWAQDRYMPVDSKSKIVRALAVDNQVHHEKPTQMLTYGYFETIKYTAMLTVPLSIVLLFVGTPLWVWLGVFLASGANLVHRFGHTPRRQLPRWIRGLQEFGFFISPEHHDEHHREMGKLISKQHAHRSYCPMTDWVNPVLDKIRLWDAMEWVLARVGLRPLPA